MDIDVLIILVVVVIGALVAGSVGLLVFSAFIGIQRRVRDLTGTCRCGYDWSGLPTDAKCPECGGIRIVVPQHHRVAYRQLAREGIFALLAGLFAVCLTRFVIVRVNDITPVLIGSLVVLGIPGVAIRLDMWFRHRRVPLAASICGQLAIVGMHIGIWQLIRMEIDGPLPIGTLLFAVLPALAITYGGMAAYLIWSEFTR